MDDIDNIKHISDTYMLRYRPTYTSLKLNLNNMQVNGYKCIKIVDPPSHLYNASQVHICEWLYTIFEHKNDDKGNIILNKNDLIQDNIIKKILEELNIENITISMWSFSVYHKTNPRYRDSFNMIINLD